MIYVYITEPSYRTDTILVSWLDILQERLQEFFGPSRDQPTFSDDAFLYPSWSLALLEPHPDPELSQPTNTASHVPGRLGRASLNGAKDITVQVAENHRLTPPSHFQEVRSVRLVGRELSNCRPGDAVGMFPRNAELDVHALLVLLKAEAVADCPLKIVSLTSRAEDIPKSLIQHAGLLTLRSIAANQLDLNSVPRRSFIRRISYFASEPAERERLRELSSSEFIEEYYDYVTRPRRTTLELLQDFSSVTIPWSYAASIIPLMHVRWFSISRSMALDAPNQRGSVQQSAVVPAVELLIATVDYQTVIRKRRKGVCTNYIATVKPGTSLRVLYQQGSIITSLSDHTRSAIMIGTGTGIAPLRSLLWERRTFGTDSEARVLLFFGGRNIRADYFFCDEWDDLAKDLHLQVFPTFSRDQRQKHYVQDKLHEESALLWEIINEEQGIVYVCGSSGKMPAAVRQTLVDVFQKEGKMSSEKANAYILAMIQANRYKQETW